MFMRKLVVICSVAVIAVVATPAAAATEPVKVIGGPEAQFFPFVNATHLIWTQNSELRPNRYNAFGRLLAGGEGDEFKLNEAGTNGFTGGIDPGTNLAIYQQTDGDRSNLWTFDLVTEERVKLPQPVNSGRWEWAPRISNAYILFQRDEQDNTTLYLFERGGDSLSQLHSIDRDRAFMIAGVVGEQYATWTVCAQQCNAFVYEIATDTKTKLPLPKGRNQYAPAVDEDRGNVYFVRSGNACGLNVGIWRRAVDLSTPAEKLVTLPDDIDTGWTFALDEDIANARVDGWFEYFRCRSQQGDVYEVQELDSLV
jgi:hypothetical protein